MPTFLNWLLRLLPTNPICLRLVQVGSVRMRHLTIRAGYLAVMIVVLLVVLLNSVSGGGTMSIRELAGAGAQMFQSVSYLQVGLICLLTPVFMAGAIAQEANPRTWEILLTTPLNNLQIVLGNLFGRLFFVIALLFSSMPLFVMTQYFGGVPGESIFASYAIAGASALVVAAIAITLSVTRTAGRRAVFLFYVSVVLYICVTWAADRYLRQPVGTASSAFTTTAVTPLNPFLALKVLLDSNHYVPRTFTPDEGVSWFTRAWLGRPIAVFCWLCVVSSAALALFSTVRLRVIGARLGTTPWYRRLVGLSARGAAERAPRHVGRNPIAWRESVARGRTFPAIAGRWGFVLAGCLLAVVMLVLFHVGQLNGTSVRLAFASVVGAEMMIVVLAALNMSATAVSREREDGTLDLILTTPIQPGPYIAGKHRGLFQYLVPMMAVPIFTAAIFAIYVLIGGLDRVDGVQVTETPRGKTGTVTLPVILPEIAIVLPLVLAGFVAFSVMVGLHWSIRSKGTIGSVLGAVLIVAILPGLFGLCLMPTGGTFSTFGAWFNALSPANSLFATVYPAWAIPDAVTSGEGAMRGALVVGALCAAAGYAAAAYAIHSNMKRTFMMTVRRLAGTN
jgi:ABC-type transport system involved in multi-copper enzyme maturation permease subunit